MIQSINPAQQTIQAAPKKSVEKTDENFKIQLENDESEIIVDKYGAQWKFGLRIGRNAVFSENFTKEQIERWQQSADKVDATHRAFLHFIADAGERSQEAVSFSIHYFDFCYLLEQGEVVNEQNVGLTEAIIKDRNWGFSVLLTERYGVRDVEDNKRQLDIMRMVMDLGMVSKDKGFMSLEDMHKLFAKKKAKEQQLLLERAFERKHFLEAQLNKKL